MSTFQSRRKRKIQAIDNNTKLKLDYKNVNKNDIYGFYLTNKTLKSKTKNLPMIGSFVDIYPDYMALCTEPGIFKKTNDTCVCWFKNDFHFDTIDGLNNAIIYKDIGLLRYYKSRFNGVKFFITPDYSTYGDFDEDMLVHNIRRGIIDYLWLTFELDAIVFPLMTYGDRKSLSWCFEHIMIGSNVAISLKGVTNNVEKELFLIALKVLIDTRKPKALIVYSVSPKIATYEMLSYALDHKIDIIIVPNTLMERNCRGDV